MKHRRPCSVWLMVLIGPLLAVMASTGTGCGVDESLICGAPCDPALHGAMSGSPGGPLEAGAGADDATSDSTGNADDAAQPDNSVAVSDAQDESTGDGAMANDSPGVANDGNCRGTD